MRLRMTQEPSESRVIDDVAWLHRRHGAVEREVDQHGRVLAMLHLIEDAFDGMTWRTDQCSEHEVDRQHDGRWHEGRQASSFADNANRYSTDGTLSSSAIVSSSIDL